MPILSNGSLRMDTSIVRCEVDQLKVDVGVQPVGHDGEADADAIGHPRRLQCAQVFRITTWLTAEP